jgi:hypothetical protein
VSPLLLLADGDDDVVACLLADDEKEREKNVDGKRRRELRAEKIWRRNIIMELKMIK